MQSEFALLEDAGAGEKFFAESDKNSCILVIGSTGFSNYILKIQWLNAG